MLQKLASFQFIGNPRDSFGSNNYVRDLITNLNVYLGTKTNGRGYLSIVWYGIDIEIGLSLSWQEDFSEVKLMGKLHGLFVLAGRQGIWFHLKNFIDFVAFQYHAFCFTVNCRMHNHFGRLACGYMRCMDSERNSISKISKAMKWITLEERLSLRIVWTDEYQFSLTNVNVRPRLQRRNHSFLESLSELSPIDLMSRSFLRSF